MDRDQLDRLDDVTLSYREVGATGVALPDGYPHLARDVVVGHGPDAFTAASRCVMTWEMHRGAGLEVIASAPEAHVGVNVLMRVGPSWSPVTAPCRVVHARREPDRVGFTYGTLRGHPFAGEESFDVLLTPDGDVRFVLIAFSRPASLAARLTGAIGRTVAARASNRIADRYVRTVAEAAASA